MFSFLRSKKLVQHQLMVNGRQVLCVVERSARRKRTVVLRVQGVDKVRLVAPMRLGDAALKDFLHRQAGWIARHMADAFSKAAPTACPQTSMIYLGRAYALEVTEDAESAQQCVLWPRRMKLCFPHAATQDDITLALRLWLKKRAKAKFTRRLDYWAARLGVQYQKMMLTNAGTRWGSCNAQNAIRLHWRLIMAPLPLLDYVVVHELCHVRHKHHGAAFWHQVESVMPDYAARRKELHKLGPHLILSAMEDEK